MIKAALLVFLISTTQGVDSTPPAIQVLGPADSTVSTERVVTFWGVTEWGATVSSGPFLADTDEYGEWAIDLVLEAGQNGAVFTSTDAAGNEKSVRITVAYEEPEKVVVERQEPVRVLEVTPVVKVVSTTTTTVRVPDPKPVVTETGTERWRLLVEQHFDSSQVATAMRVMACESGGNPDARNRSSGAGGLFQHLPKFWASRAAQAGYPGVSIYDPEANIAATAWLVENDGWGHWTCY